MNAGITESHLLLHYRYYGNDCDDYGDHAYYTYTTMTTTATTT